MISFGNGRNRIPFTRADILGAAIADIVDGEPFREGVYNFTGAAGRGCHEFIAERMRKLGVACRFVRVPALPVRALAACMEYLWMALGRKKPPFLTRYLVDSATRDIEYDNSRARADFGWDPEQAVES